MEATARQDQEAQSVIKGKRTKRQRPLSPLSLAMPNSSSSSTTSTNPDLHRLAVPSPTSGFTDVSCCTEEEEDMAHCLILLAQGQSGTTQKPTTLGLALSETPRIKSFKVVGSDGLLSYQCKTCDRSFPSFQALGGHRASHKIKPRPVPGTEQNRGISMTSLTSAPATAAVTLTLQTPNRVNDPIKSKVHECSVCGVEFTSGQALGGHMRRHRTLLPASTATATTSTSTSLDTAGDVFNREFRPEAKKQRTTQLELDLNLPAAPEEDCREPKFGFPAAAKEQVLMFSASPLVDCCRY